ncbi:hypothetical protein VPH35_074425 [Triticum aestivum]
MAAQGRGDAGRRTSRVDVLQLLRPSGEHPLAYPLQVDCLVGAPGLRRLAWSAPPTGYEPGFTFADQELYQAGLLAGGFDDGTVRIWNPEPALLWDLNQGVAEKPKPVLKMDDNPALALVYEKDLPQTVSGMNDTIGKIEWASRNTKWKKTGSNVRDTNAEWYICPKEVHYQVTNEMDLLTESHDLEGPVLGLSFSDIKPHLIATGASDETITIHDLSYPIKLSNLTLELKDAGSSEVETEITSLKWNKIYPCILASTTNKGSTSTLSPPLSLCEFVSLCVHVRVSLSISLINYFAEFWDIRAKKSLKTCKAGKVKMCSDLEFSLRNPMHAAVSTVDNGASAAVTIWDMRKLIVPYYQYNVGAPGVISLSWNHLGQLLASHVDGSISCYDVYDRKMVEGGSSYAHADLGVTWTHSENVVAALSSKKGVRLYQH